MSLMLLAYKSGQMARKLRTIRIRVKKYKCQFGHVHVRFLGALCVEMCGRELYMYVWGPRQKLVTEVQIGKVWYLKQPPQEACLSPNPWLL